MENQVNHQPGAKVTLSSVPKFYMSNGVKVENTNFIWADRQNGIRQPGYELFGCG